MGDLLALHKFDLENEQVLCPWGPTDSISKVLTDIHVKYWQKLRRNSGSPKIHGLGLFDLENGPVYPWGPTDSIAKVLTEVLEIFWQKSRRNFGSTKIHAL
ncbi:hypothetical protein H5410_029240 [Solanum commersonii]|uniref:Uncharacterized protein n=1 Tax=Solanum commersonii TaxID=4109 RepID=A0A9J5Z8F6_SOLCO|nr:hypothetical protein H5410_029240 [Solanum commersonii]